MLLGCIADDLTTAIGMLVKGGLRTAQVMGVVGKS